VLKTILHRPIGKSRNNDKGQSVVRVALHVMGRIYKSFYLTTTNKDIENMQQ